MIPSPDDSVLPSGGSRALGVFGSTGSIGRQTLEVVDLFPDRFDVRLLSAERNARRLVAQARRYEPEAVVIGREELADPVREALGDRVTVWTGTEGLERAAAEVEMDVMMAAIVGFAGLPPVVAALRRGTLVALANKETLVVGGALIRDLVRATGGAIVPVDSEHSAIFQCLVGERETAIDRIVLTASGGPFWDRPEVDFSEVDPAEALDHPNWSMGKKITIDSATLMNKGLEVIEARWLFGLEPDQIDVVVHPQSIVHSLVEFVDGSVKAELGVPDMKVPIQYALSFPERWPADHERLDFSSLGALSFHAPDRERFPCLRLAYEALESGGTAPAILNGANEAAVEAFLDERISLAQIPLLVERTLERIDGGAADSLEALRTADRRAREAVGELTRSMVD